MPPASGLYGTGHFILHQIIKKIWQKESPSSSLWRNTQGSSPPTLSCGKKSGRNGRPRHLGRPGRKHTALLRGSWPSGCRKGRRYPSFPKAAISGFSESWASFMPGRSMCRCQSSLRKAMTLCSVSGIPTRNMSWCPRSSFRRSGRSFPTSLLWRR